MLEIAAYFDTSLATFSALTFEKKSSSLVAIQYNNFFWKVVYT